MCRFLLWMIFLLYFINDSEGLNSIRARHGIVRTRNFESATFEWQFFGFEPTTPIFMGVDLMDERNPLIRKSRILYSRNGQFYAYEHIKDRVRITMPPNRKGVIIDISNIVISDGGDYKFKAMFSDHEDVVNISRLIVIVPPSINAHQLLLRKVEGQNASLLCNLDAGNPKPLTFQWSKIIDSEKKVLTPVKTRDFNLTYYIPLVGRDSVGKYRCDVGGLGGVDSHIVDLFVKYKPVVTSPPLNQSVFEKFGTDHFRCLAEGNAGETRYHWYKDYPFLQYEIEDGNKDMMISSDRTTLTFVTPERKLSTTYYCAGSNRLGTGRPKGAFLNVTYKPGAIEIATDDGGNIINGKEGDNLTVSCYSDANPAAHYNWYKKVKTFWGSIEKEYHVRYSINGALNLYKVDRNDTANYVCEALNRPNDEDRSKVYTVSREVMINIRFGPRQTNFTVNDINHTYIEVPIYSRVTIRCVSHSEPGASYNIRTQRDRTQLNPDIKIGVYVIDRILNSQEGEYICISSNALTDKYEKRVIKLVVAVPPTTFEQVPGSKTLTEGASVSIDCIAKGKPAPRVFWQRWGANITHNDSVIQTYYTVRPVKQDVILSVVDASLKFTHIRYTDDASYSCVMYNSAGKLNISGIRYIVQYSPKITTLPGNYTRLVGEKVAFVCDAFGSPSSVEWRWYFNEVEKKGEIKNTLEIGYTTPDDNGYYKCVPWNIIGDGEVGLGHLEVQYEPRFIKIPEYNYTGEVTQTLIIRCDAVGVPTPEIYWLKGGSDSAFRRNGNELKFESLKPSDRGKYSCVAKNVIRAVSEQTLIIIRHCPIITTNTPSSTKVASKDGVPVSLRCEVDAYPAPTIQWKDKMTGTVIANDGTYKITNEKRLFGGTSTLTFTVHSYQLGKKYECYAQNECGGKADAASQIFQVLVEGKPDPPESRSLKAVDYLIPTVPVTVNINFTWIAGYNGGAEVDFYLLFREKRESRFHEHHMSNTENFKYVFENRIAGASYVFSMKASNKYGVSLRYQPYLEFNTKDPPLDAANVTIERIGKDGTSVRIFWQIRPTLEARQRRAVENKWDYGVIKYKFADTSDDWVKEKILNIAMKGSYVVENLEPEQLYVFHFILYDKYDNFANPILVSRMYPRYGPTLSSRSELTRTDIIAIGVACGGAILIVAVVVLVIAICKKKKKPAYGIASYGNGRTRVDIPVSTTVKSGGYNEEAAPKYFKPDEEDDDEDPLAQDSGSGLDAGDKSPPPDYNAVHYRVPPRENPNQSSFSDDMSPSYTTFGRLAKRPQFNSKDDGLGQPLLRKSNNELDEDYRKPPERSQGQRGSRGHLSSDEDIPEPPRPPPAEESDVNNRVPGAFGDRAQRFKKPPAFKPYDDENGSLSPPNQNASGRESPNGSSVASSKPYRSDNEYIEEADENYVGYLV